MFDRAARAFRKCPFTDPAECLRSAANALIIANRCYAGCPREHNVYAADAINAAVSMLNTHLRKLDEDLFVLK